MTHAAPLRIARRCADPFALAAQYRDGFGMTEHGRFSGHDGHDGVMLGWPAAGWHIELVRTPEPRRHVPDSEDALVIYEPAADAWQARVDALERAGFVRVRAGNPYWQQHGASFDDAEGFRWIIARQAGSR
jgi:uncharacterized glyoxalase superfamily protein PhnB